VESTTYHEISLHELELAREPILHSVAGGACDLVVVVVETSDVGVGELGNLPSRPANTAANVEDLHPRLDANLRGQVVLVAGDCLIEALTGRIPGEMEGLAPAIFIKVGREVIVAMRRVKISDRLETEAFGR